jgi:hypothetical protein
VIAIAMLTGCNRRCSGSNARRVHAGANSKHRATPNSARSRSALSGFRPDLGRLSEIRTNPGQPTAEALEIFAVDDSSLKKNCSPLDIFPE